MKITFLFMLFSFFMIGCAHPQYLTEPLTNHHTQSLQINLPTSWKKGTTQTEQNLFFSPDEKLNNESFTYCKINVKNPISDSLKTRFDQFEPLLPGIVKKAKPYPMIEGETVKKIPYIGSFIPVEEVPEDTEKINSSYLLFYARLFSTTNWYDLKIQLPISGFSDSEEREFCIQLLNSIETKQ